MTDTEFVGSFEELKRQGKVVPIGVVEKMLEATEPLERFSFPSSGTDELEFVFDENWNEDIKTLDPSSLVPVKVIYKDKEYQATKGAIVSFVNKIGLSEKYATKCPGHLIEAHLNYWVKNGGIVLQDEMDMVTHLDFVVGFIESQSPTISNVLVLRTIKNKIKELTGFEDLYIDPRIEHNYIRTNFRIILPEESFKVTTKRNGVPSTDTWHIGFHISNSLVANSKKNLVVSGFVVEQDSLAGIIPEYSASATYSRNRSTDSDDLVGWLGSVVSQALAALPIEGEMMQNMPNHSLEGKISTLTSDIFRDKRVPVKIQSKAIDILTEEGDMTTYGVMMSLSKAVSGEEQQYHPPSSVFYIQALCGTLPSSVEEMCDSCGRLHIYTS